MLARTNACRLWTLDDATGDDAADSLRAFDTLYLRHPESYFYDGETLPNAAFHYDVVRACHNYDYNAVAAPRGFAKSTLLRKMILMKLTTKPAFSITYATSSMRLMRKSLGILMRQWDNNALLVEDWAQLWGIRSIKPNRGSGRSWSLQGEVDLLNDSRLYGTSTDSKLRGDRPMEFDLDDPEFDAAASTDMSVVRSNMEELLFKIIMPMVQRRGAGVNWFGTLISRRHFLYQAVAGSAGEEGLTYDERFDYWNTMRLKALYTEADGSQHSLWPEYKTVEDLHRLRKILGEPVFLSEYMNEPGSGDGVAFHLSETHHSYRINMDQADDRMLTAPYESSTPITYFDSKNVRVTQTMRDFLRDSLVFMCVDWAETITKTSDYSAAVVMALTPDNQLFVLDMSVGRVLLSDLTKRIIELAYRWYPQVIGVEAFAVFQNAKNYIDTELRKQGSITGYFPQVHPINPKGMKKESKIAGLTWRFGDANNPYGGIKLPFEKRTSAPWSMLFEQITNFNPMAGNGGNTHDDILDAVSMSQLLIPGLPTRANRQAVTDKPIVDRIMEGETHDPLTGDPLATHLNFHETPAHILNKIIEVLNNAQPDRPARQSRI